jgi:hypothetical protein
VANNPLILYLTLLGGVTQKEKISVAFYANIYLFFQCIFVNIIKMSKNILKMSLELASVLSITYLNYAIIGSK